MNNEIFQLQPIGGLGRIGANMLLLKSGKRGVVIDAGILFPKNENFGLNFLIPDFYSAVDKKEVDSLIITHGHEDHIGAILFMIEHLPSIKIYAPRFATRLIRKKMAEAKVSAKIIEYCAETKLDFETFSIHPFPVNHSIPDTFGFVAIDNSKKFSVGYFSDFKIDQKTTYEKRFDKSALTSLMHSAKSRILLTDSTSVLSKKDRISEIDLVNDIEDVIREAKSRVFITCFSSNIFRIQTIINAAGKTNKKVVPYGRSMHFYIQTALELKILNDPNAVLRDVASIDPTSDNLVVLLSGCQGEFKGTMRRVAMEEDTIFKINSKDTFVFSSKTIPGNEVNISTVMNSLAKNDISIVTSDQKLIHASGHATSNELLDLYNTIHPNYIVPIHGETYLLRQHLKLVKDNSNSKGIFLTNGDTLSLFSDGEYKLTTNEEPTPLMIHGSNVVIDRQAISQRRKLSESGIIFVSIKHESIPKKRPIFVVDHMGLPSTATSSIDLYRQFLQGLLKSIKISSKDKAIDEVRVATRRFFIPHIGYRPLAIIQFV